MRQAWRHYDDIARLRANDLGSREQLHHSVEHIEHLRRTRSCRCGRAPSAPLASVTCTVESAPPVTAVREKLTFAVGDPTTSAAAPHGLRRSDWKLGSIMDMPPHVPIIIESMDFNSRSKPEELDRICQSPRQRFPIQVSPTPVFENRVKEQIQVGVAIGDMLLNVTQALAIHHSPRSWAYLACSVPACAAA